MPKTLGSAGILSRSSKSELQILDPVIENTDRRYPIFDRRRNGVTC